MCLSTFIAQVLGCYFFLVCLAMLVHQQRYKRSISEFLASQAMVTFSGMIWFLLGLMIVISHNVWMTEWPVVVTVIGWIMLLQGLLRIFFPDSYAHLMRD